jgi:tetratricopeptide (TPR) repeat protein
VLTDLGQVDEAEKNLRDALDMLVKLKLAEHGNTTDALAALGTVLAKKGDLTAAETHLQSALDRRMNGAESLDVADSLDALAIVKAMRGDLPAAKELLVQAITMNEKGVGSEHVNLIPHRFHLAWVLQQQGDATIAAAEHAQALTNTLKRGVYGGWPFLKGIFDLTDVLQAQNRFAEAELLLTEAGEHAEKNLRESVSLQEVTFQRLRNFYESWNRATPDTTKAGQAAEWGRRLELVNQQAPQSLK